MGAAELARQVFTRTPDMDDTLTTKGDRLPEGRTMAELNSRVDSFITLLLDVTGRARPEDLDAHTPSGADELLQSYAQAHGDRSLSFDGDALIAVAAPATADVQGEPEPAPFDEVVTATEPESFVLDAAAIPEVSVASVPVDESSIPSVFDPGALPEVMLEPQAPAGAPSLDAVLPVIAEPLAQMPAYVAPAEAEPSLMKPVADSGPAAAPTGGIPTAEDSSFFEFGPAVDATPAPIEPATYELPEIPVIPEAAELPVILESPDLPMTPEAPEMPVMSDVPDLAPIPEIPVIPEVPAIEPPVILMPENAPVIDAGEVSLDEAEPELVMIPMPPEEDAGGFIDLDAAMEQQPSALDDFVLPDLPVIEPSVQTGANPFELPADLEDPDGF